MKGRAYRFMTTQILKRYGLVCALAVGFLPTHSALLGLSDDVTASPRVVFHADHSESVLLNAGVANVAPKPIQVASATAVNRAAKEGVKALMRRFEAMGYELDMVRQDDAPVPRVFVVALPDDLDAVRQVELKKSVFFKTTLPLILKENERITADRRELVRISNLIERDQELNDADAEWIERLARRYKADIGDIDTLLARVDIIPVSLAMAQAAEESGWGTSRFAQRGNALFGQWTTADDEGLIPKERQEGMTHKVKKFDNLAASVAGYMRNLNTHGAYKSLRAARTQMRKTDGNINGYALAGELLKYSARGQKYVDSIRLIIDANDLHDLDDATLLASDQGEQSA